MIVIKTSGYKVKKKKKKHLEWISIVKNYKILYSKVSLPYKLRF